MTVYCVKVRRTGKKRWGFITSNGGVNHLRIHAAQFRDLSKANDCVADISANNPGGEWEAKSQVLFADKNDA